MMVAPVIAGRKTRALLNVILRSVVLRALHRSIARNDVTWFVCLSHIETPVFFSKWLDGYGTNASTTVRSAKNAANTAAMAVGRRALISFPNSPRAARPF